ncbi:MAG: hypothetical protein ACKO14_05420, partial [Armatimonadota bacterium]
VTSPLNFRRHFLNAHPGNNAVPGVLPVYQDKHFTDTYDSISFYPYITHAWTNGMTGIRVSNNK